MGDFNSVFNAIKNYNDAYNNLDSTIRTNVWTPVKTDILTTPSCLNELNTFYTSTINQNPTTAQTPHCNTYNISQINNISNNSNRNKFGEVVKKYYELQSAYTNYSYIQNNYLNGLDNSYNNIKTTRSSLDNELLNLYNVQGTIPDIYKKQVDSSLYAGILWMVLATSLLYYVFIKI